MSITTNRLPTSELSLRLVLVGLSLVLSFVIGEVTCRLFFPNVELHYISDPEALYHMAPNQVGSIRMANGFLSPAIRINHLGLRGPELNDSDTRAILVLGDSFTFGAGVGDNETFAARLGQALDGKARVVNGGQPGYGVFQMAATLRRIGDQLRPSLVIAVLWQGDFLRQPPDVAERDKFFRRRRILDFVKTSVLLTQAGRGLERLLLRYGLSDWVQHAGTHDASPRSDPKAVIDAHLRGVRADFPRLVDMHREARQYGHGLLLMLWPKEDFAHVAEAGLADKLTDALGVFARKEGIPFISVQPSMRGVAPALLLIRNDWHPTPLAHCLAAQSIASELTRLKFETFGSKPCSAKEPSF